MTRSLTVLATSISRSLLSLSNRSLFPRTWTPSLEQALHRLGCRDSLSPQLVARVIDPFLLTHHSLSLGFFNWASQQPNFSHSATSFAAVLRSLASSRHFKAVDNILKQVRSRNVCIEPCVYRDIVSNRVFWNKTLDAFWVHKMGNCDIGCNGFNSLLAGLGSDGHLECAHEVFDEMIERGVVLSTVGFGVFLWRFCRNAEMGEVLGVLDEGKKGVWGVNGSVLAVLVVHGLCLENRVKDAFLVLDELRKRECKPDFMAYRVVAEAFRLNGYVVDVEVTLKKKRKFGVAPRGNDYREFLFALMSEKRFWEAKELGDVIVSGNFPIEDDVLNALIESVSVLYPSSGMMFLKFMVRKETFPTLLTLSNFCTNLCKHEKIDDLLEVSELLTSKEYFSDIGSYSVMVSYLCKAGRVKEAYEAIESMKKKGLSPDVSIYNYIIEACCREGFIRPAKRLWDEMFKSGCSGDLKTYNILIKKFSETGQIKEACGLFSRMLEKGVVPDAATYTCLLQGLCKGKELKNALEIFSKSAQQDPLLARSILNTFIISLCEEGYFGAASELLSGLTASIGRSDSHVILLKWLVEAGDVPLAIEHFKSIGQISITLLQQVCRELEVASVPAFSNPNPIMQLLKAVDERLQVPHMSSREGFSLIEVVD